MAFFYKMIILLGNLRFCFYFRLVLDLGALGNFSIIKCTKILNTAPFGFILNLLDNDGAGLVLECSDKTYNIPPDELQCIDDCTCDGTPIDTDDNSDGPCCPNNDGGCSSAGVCFGFAVITPDVNNCFALQQLEDWKCCAILDAARENNAIRFSFHDAWLNGSAYLYQFRAKARVRNDGSRKDKFCGPGSDNDFGANYSSWDGYSNCSLGQCLILGPSISEDDRNYVGGTQQLNPFISIPQNSPGVPNGANDSGEFLYCNWASSTKIISLGPIEMCEDAFQEIQECIYTNTENLAGTTVLDCSISDLRLGDGKNPYTGDNYGVISSFTIPTTGGLSVNYNAPQVIKVGTGGENGFDRQETTKKLTESSYADPEEVLIYYLKLADCDFKDLFRGGGGCTEYELEDEYQRGVRKVCQIQNEINLRPPFNSETQSYDFEAPEVWDVDPSVASIVYNDPDVISGPFEIDTLLESRYHPNYEGDNSNAPSSQGNFANPHIDSKTNMPYFYFGLVPGKSAMDKFREKYLVD